MVTNCLVGRLVTNRCWESWRNTLRTELAGQSQDNAAELTLKAASLTDDLESLHLCHYPRQSECKSLIYRSFWPLLVTHLF